MMFASSPSLPNLQQPQLQQRQNQLMGMLGSNLPTGMQPQFSQAQNMMGQMQGYQSQPAPPNMPNYSISQGNNAGNGMWGANAGSQWNKFDQGAGQQLPTMQREFQSRTPGTPFTPPSAMPAPGAMGMPPGQAPLPANWQPLPQGWTPQQGPGVPWQRPAGAAMGGAMMGRKPKAPGPAMGGAMMGRKPKAPGHPMLPMFGHSVNPLSMGMHRLGMGNPLNTRPHFAPGGMPMPGMARGPLPPLPGGGHRAPNGDPIHTGPIRSPVAGRTDHLAISVPAKSYVIPADVVNHWGQDNTEAGHRIMDKLFKGTAIKNMRKFIGPNAEHVPIAAAGGEYVIPPESAAHWGGGDVDKGHKIFDKFVKDSRRDHIAKLQKMPGPEK